MPIIVDSKNILAQWAPEETQNRKVIDLNRKEQHRAKQFMREYTDPDPKDSAKPNLKRNAQYSDNDFSLQEKIVKSGSRRRSIPKSSRKYKKSAKRVFRKKSRSTRRR
jgi:hypothetical protein